MPTGYQLFNREFNITVGGILIPSRAIDPGTGKMRPSLRVKFNIEKTDDSTPNKADVEIYNLNSDHRGAVQEGWPVTVEGGYENNSQRLFGGWIEESDSSLQGVDWVTSLEVSDGGNVFRTARVKLSFGKGTTLATLLTAIARELGLGLGNSAQKFASSQRGLTAFKKGVSVSGQAVKVLNKYIASAGYQWSIQDGILQILEPGETTSEGIPILNPGSGLVGSPERGEKGKVKAKALLNGAIKPGGRVGFKTSSVEGYYKVKKLNYVGDTWGADWFVNFECVPVQP